VFEVGVAGLRLRVTKPNRKLAQAVYSMRDRWPQGGTRRRRMIVTGGQGQGLILKDLISDIANEPDGPSLLGAAAMDSGCRVGLTGLRAASENGV
jgi:hypothetical protein